MLIKFANAKQTNLGKIFVAALLLITLSLSGCSPKVSKKKKDGPPKHVPAHLLKTPDAVPKVEPLSRFGNRFGKNGKSNSYVVFNRRYHVKSTSKGYKARGKASWYGTQFHGRKTSNGERYNMFAMTAAHPTLPLPSYVKVTNLANKKSVIVKVNDRGPFHPGRLIDLSYVAAAKLGVLGTGTAHVEVVSVDPRDHGGKTQIKLPNQEKGKTLSPSHKPSSYQMKKTTIKTISKRNRTATKKKN